jgi:hypothetical protein
MITNSVSIHLRLLFRRVATFAAALLVALQCGPIQGEEKQTSPHDIYRQMIYGTRPEEDLAQLAKQIEAQEHDLAKAQETNGANDARIIQAKKELENSRRLFAIQKKLFELSQGESNEVNQAEIAHLRNEMYELMTKQLLGHHTVSRDGIPGELQHQLESMRQQLEQRERQVVELKQQFAKLERERALPPLENGQIKIFTLKNANARGAASTITSLFGAQAMRVAVDDRTNSLVVFGKDDSLPVFEALVQRLDSQATADKSGKNTVESSSESHRTVLLRLFWVADNIRKGGEDPENYLPKSVLAATQKLGLNAPRLISQTVTSLSVGRKETVDFTSDVPAVLDGQPANLTVAGKVRLTPGDDDRVDLQMKIQVHNPGVQCSVQGSLASPLGHYMVLGTANSLSSDLESIEGMGGIPQGLARPGMGPGRTGIGRANPGRVAQGPHREFGAPGAAEPEGAEMTGEQPPAKPTFDTSRFAFVVQVVNAESYADDQRNTPESNRSSEANQPRQREK